MTNEKTQWLFDEQDNGAGGSGRPEFTETIDPAHGDRTYAARGEATVQIDTNAGRGASEKTQIARPGRATQAPVTLEEESDPVVGWLVVVKGPGLGRAVTLGIGMNTVGRGPEARVSLPFGDLQISNNDHLRVIYDDRERAFHIAHGSGRNISRVNGQLLANTLPLENDALIAISETTHLRFKQFCGTDFDWADVEATGSEAK